jgi:hypothetical protein
LNDVTLTLEVAETARLSLPAVNIMRDHLIQALRQG